MLRQRVLTAVLLAPLVILIILLAPEPLFGLIAGLSFLAAMWEWTRLSGVHKPIAQYFILAVAAALLLGLWWLRATALWPVVLVAGVLWWLAACLWLRHFAFGAAPTPEKPKSEADCRRFRDRSCLGRFLYPSCWRAARSLVGFSGIDYRVGRRHRRLFQRPLFW